jgi:HD-like signal output (HDOD) protein
VDKKTPHDLIMGDIQFSTPPFVYSKLNTVINNPHSSILDMGMIISEDQSLTARILRLANSPFFAFPSTVETVTQAVTIIGTQQILDLVLATSVIKLFEGIPEDLITVGEFWRHSLGCAVIARIIAIYKREPNVERFFVAGILHDIGRLIICTKIPEMFREVVLDCREHGELLFVGEQKAIGFDHAEMGDVLLDEWKIPLSLREIVACHHYPLRAKHFPTGAAVVHIAEFITHAMQFGRSGDPYVPPLNTKAWEMLDLRTGLISPIFDQAERHFNAALQLLGLDL